MSDARSHSGSDNENDLVVIDYNQVRDYNTEQILPQKQEVLRDIRAWLKPTAYDLPSGEFGKHLASHMADTGSWITSDRLFKNWLNEPDDGLLWIQGVPGSGKSVVAATLVEQLKQVEPKCTVLFFFFRQIIDANHKPQALLRDWMHQVLDQSPVLQAKLAQYLELRRSMDSMSMDDLWNDLKMALSALPNKVFCIADALDEMDQGNDSFLTELGSLGRWRPNKVKVLMTSRPVAKLEPPLRALAPKHLRLQADQVDRDISIFVHRSLEKSSIPREDWDRVTDAVPGRANGIFLYAKLAMDAFLEPGANLENVLSQLPEDLNVLYTKLLREHARRSAVAPETQRLLLQSVTHARRPLRLLELAELMRQSLHGESSSANSLKEAKDLIRAACGPLLEILPDETVSVIHHSFTEYLKGTTRFAEEIHEYPILEPGPTHDQLARACLKYLLSGCLRSVSVKETPKKPYEWNRTGLGKAQSPEMTNVTLKHPFTKYAIQHWDYHVRQSEAAQYDQGDATNLIAVFLNDDLFRKAWLELVWPDSASNVTQLHIAGHLGLSAYTRSLLMTMDVNTIDGQGKTPIWWAARSGHKDAAAILLAAGADPDKDELVYGLKPLHQAAKANHVEVVSLLLEAGVDPLTPKTRENLGMHCGNARSSVGDTPLLYACNGKHTESIKALLEYVMKKDPRHALLSALRQKQPELAAHIISEPNFDVDYIESGQTPLQVACASCDLESVKMLLKAGADVKKGIVDDSGTRMGYEICQSRHEDEMDKAVTAPCLHALAKSVAIWQTDEYPNDREETLKDAREICSLLIAEGFDVNQRDSSGGTALHCAANSTFMIDLLLSAGADGNATNYSGHTPLFFAKSKKAMSMLIGEGHTDINHKDSINGQTALLWNLAQKDFKAVFALLEHNPDCKVIDTDGKGALHHAVVSFRTSSELIGALFSRGADLNLKDNTGLAPLFGLQHGLSSHDKETLSALLNMGADINITNRQGRTWLFQCIKYMDYGKLQQMADCLQDLMQKGASISCRDFQGRTLLHEAVKVWKLEAIISKERLLALSSLGLNLKDVDYSGNTLLHEFASRPGIRGTYDRPQYVAAFDALVSLGIDIEQKNHSGQTVLHLLCSTGVDDIYLNVGVTKIMPIDRAIGLMKTVNVCDNNGIMPLHIASTLGQFFTKKLLDAGADATARTYEGLCALHLAARCRQSNIVGLLLEHLRWQSKQIVVQSTKPGSPTGSPIPVISNGDQWFINQVNCRVYGRPYQAFTPLHFACMSGTPETVDILLQNGANWNSWSVMEACKAFESEDRLWRKQSGAMQPCVMLADTHRTLPDQPYTGGLQKLSLEAEARMEEIIDMLLARGLRPEKPYFGNRIYGLPSHSPRDAEPWHDGVLDYVKTCIERSLYKYEPENSKTMVKALSIPQLIHQRLFEATEKSLRDCAAGDQPLLTKENSNSGLMVHFLESRRYYAVGLLQELGADFIVKSEQYGMSNLAILASHGFARLVESVGVPEVRDRFPGGKWRAFDDLSREGLHRQTDTINVNDKKAYDDSPILMRAIQRVQPNLEVVKVLVEKLGVSLDEVSDLYKNNHEQNRTSALLYASQGYYWWHANQAVPYLIQAGANLEVTNHKGRTPLLVALAESNKNGVFAKDVCRALVLAGANVSAMDAKGTTCLARATHDIDLLRLLLDHGAQPTPIALFAAINAERVDAVRVLLQRGLDPNLRTGETIAQDGGMSLPDFVDSQFAFERYVNGQHNLIEPRERFALHLAARAESREAGAQMVRMLLEQGADPLAKYLRKIKSVATKNKSACIDDDEDEDYVTRPTSATMPSVAVPEGYEERTLLHAVLEGRAAVHEFFKISNFDINHRDAKGQTVLLATCNGPTSLDEVACFTTEKELSKLEPENISKSTVMQRLVSLGADVEACDKEGRNALHLIGCRKASDQKSCTESVKEICRLAPNLVNQADVRGCTPLHCALSTGMALSKLLLKHGADATAVTGKGDSALHILSPNLRTEAVRSLFVKLVKEHGLDINAKNRRGETPLFGWCRVARDCTNHISQSLQSEAERHELQEVTSFLQELGTDFLATDERGRSLLHVSAHKSAACFQWYMNLGIDPLLEDVRQQTAIDVAAANNNKEVLKLFERDKAGSE